MLAVSAMPKSAPAVHDLVPVRIVGRRRHLRGDADRTGHGELLLPAQAVARRLALDERYDVAQEVVGVGRVEQRQDSPRSVVKRLLIWLREALALSHLTRRNCRLSAPLFRLRHLNIEACTCDDCRVLLLRCLAADHVTF